MPLLHLSMVEGLVAGAPCATWVLDDVVGDNISEGVSPTMVGAQSRQMFEGRPARMLAGTPVAGADRATTR